jgi:hypothetical protein
METKILETSSKIITEFENRKNWNRKFNLFRYTQQSFYSPTSLYWFVVSFFLFSFFLLPSFATINPIISPRMRVAGKRIIREILIFQKSNLSSTTCVFCNRTTTNIANSKIINSDFGFILKTPEIFVF